MDVVPADVVQTLTFRRDTPIIIRTPLGEITLNLDPEAKRKIHLTMPPWMRAYLPGKDDFARPVKLLVAKKNETYIPKFSVLVPARDSDGKFSGVTIPETLRLEDVKSGDQVRNFSVALGTGRSQT